MSEESIRFNQATFETKLDSMVRDKVEQIVNAMLDEKADRIANAARYERSDGRRACQAGHYVRQLLAKALCLRDGHQSRSSSNRKFRVRPASFQPRILLTRCIGRSSVSPVPNVGVIVVRPIAAATLHIRTVQHQSQHRYAQFAQLDHGRTQIVLIGTILARNNHYAVAHLTEHGHFIGHTHRNGINDHVIVPVHRVTQ